MKKLILFLFRYSPGLVFTAVLVGLVSGGTSTLLIAVINKGIGHQGNAPQNLLIAFVVLCLLFPISRIVSQMLLSYLSEKVVFEMRMHLAREILNMPLRSVEKKTPSALLSILTHDIAVISGALTEIPLGFMNLTIVISGFGYLFWLFWPAGLGMVFSAVVGILLFSTMLRFARKYFLASRDAQDVFFKHFEALTTGAKELMLHNERKNHFLSVMLRSVGASYRKNNIIAAAYMAGASSVAHFIVYSVVGVLVFILPGHFPDIGTEVMTGFAIFLLYLMMPLNTLTQVLPTFSVAAISLQKVEALGITMDNFSLEEPKPVVGKTTWNTIEYKGITHTYYREAEDDNFTMGPIDLTFKPGELTFLIGGNGSGKTTLAKMLLGLYIPESGEVFFDGEPVNDENRDVFRQLFTSVFSDFYLFDNLLGAFPPNADELAQDYLKRLLLDKKVRFEGGQLSTVELSQGQRKRLALLTAYLEDRQIYLFDEWAADQDPMFKDIFYNVLLPELKSRGKTIIAISHDDHYFHVADRVIKLDYGQLEYDKPANNQQPS